MASNKVIYLNEDSQELTSNKDIESQFQENTQFNNSPGESNYSVGGNQGSTDDDSGVIEDFNEDGDSNVNISKLDGGAELEDDGLTVEDRVNMSNVKLDSPVLEQNGGNDDDDGDGDGGVDDDGDAHSVSSIESGGSSVNTEQILEMDPMYIRLTKFLQTGGDNNKNMADILLDISNSFTKLNENLENLSNKMTKMSLQQ